MLPCFERFPLRLLLSTDVALSPSVSVEVTPAPFLNWYLDDMLGCCNNLVIKSYRLVL